MLTARPLPISPFDVFQSEIERLMDSALEGARSHVPNASRQGVAFPAFNAWQDDKAIYVEAELPGFKPAEVDVTFEHQTLHIKGIRSAQTSAPQTTILRRERWAGSFERSLRIATPIDAENVRASLVSGVLSVELPKHPTAQPRKITLRTA